VVGIRRATAEAQGLIEAGRRMRWRVGIGSRIRFAPRRGVTLSGSACPQDNPRIRIALSVAEQPPREARWLADGEIDLLGRHREGDSLGRRFRRWMDRLALFAGQPKRSPGETILLTRAGPTQALSRDGIRSARIEAKRTPGRDRYGQSDFVEERQAGARREGNRGGRAYANRGLSPSNIENSWFGGLK